MKFQLNSVFLALVLVPSGRAGYTFGNDGELYTAVDSVMATGYYVESEVYGPIGEWDVSKVTHMNVLFAYQTNFNEDISAWDTSKATVLSQMFEGAEAFNQDISGWDLSLATNMEAMFRSAESFNQDISCWNIHKVNTMKHMFDGASFFSENLCQWNTFDYGWYRDTGWMFQNTACPNTGSPNMGDGNKNDPICYDCTDYELIPDGECVVAGGGGGTESTAASSLTEAWKVELSDTASYADGVFTVDYTLGSTVKVGTMNIGIYKSCPGSTFSPTELALVTTAVQFMDNDDEKKSFKVLPGIKDAGEPVWVEQDDPTKGKIGIASFCYAIQLPNPGMEVVNLAQMKVTIEYSLEGDFTVSGFSTEAVETKEETRADTDRQAIASVCSDSTGSGTGGAYQPGDVFCVEVCSGEDAFTVTGITSIQAQGTTLQQSFEDVPGSQTVFDTVGDCGRAQFILNAAFFPEDGTGQVDVRGSCTFGFASSGTRQRRLGDDEEQRALQAEQDDSSANTGSFEMEVTLEAGGAEGGQAASSSAAKTTVVALTGALAGAMAWM